MKKLFYTSLIIILTVSCSQKKFDKNKWRNADAFFDGYRSACVNDLINNHLALGMEYKKVQDLIGEPKWIDESNSNKISYELEEKFGIIDPIGYLYLELEFDDSEKLAHWRIFETEFEE